MSLRALRWRFPSSCARGLATLSARERVRSLVDNASFEESGAQVQSESGGYPGEGVVTGFGKIQGRNVCVYAQDSTVKGGSLSLAQAGKICRLMDTAMAARLPIIGIIDSAGARIQDGVEAMAGYAEIFKRNVDVSGSVPQISLVVGTCAGGAVYSPALTDFVLMVEKTSHMFVTGPRVVHQVTRETVSKEQLGGAYAHTARSGVAHLSFQSEAKALADLRELVSFLPSSYDTQPASGQSLDPATRNCPELETIIPKFAVHAYDMSEIIRRVVDDGIFFEIHPFFARNILTGFARMENSTVGVVANQPLEMAGALDIHASVKAARFVRFCDAFNIPLITLVDVPGFLPGTHQEHDGIIRHGAKLIYAYAEATVPKIAVIIRKAYGGAYCVMSSQHLRGDFNFAWPNAEIAVMGARGATEILFGRGKGTGEEFHKHEVDYAQKYCNPRAAARRGYVDDVIAPSETRRVLCHRLAVLSAKRREVPARAKKHGNMPL